MKTYCIANHKGGVGKTTTALALAAGLNIKGRKTLLIDLDEQCNSTYGIGCRNNPKITSYEILMKEANAKEAIVSTENGDVIPASSQLAHIDLLLSNLAAGKEYRLLEALKDIQDDYEYCILDTPPALGSVTVNAMTASKGMIIPSSAESFSLTGIGRIIDTYTQIKQYSNPSLNILGILLVVYDDHVVLNREMANFANDTAKMLNSVVFKTKIRKCNAICKSQACGENIYTYSFTPGNRVSTNAAIDYNNFVDEFLEMEEK